MPEMDIQWTSVEVVWAQLLAYMGWPEDANRRRAHVASVLARQIGNLDCLLNDPEFQNSESARDLIVPVRDRCFRYFTEFGGYSALEPLLLPDAPQNSYPVAELNTVADILLIVRSIETHHKTAERGGGSVNKAAFLLARGRGCNGTLRSETKIEQAWRKYKSVAHLALGIRLYVRAIGPLKFNEIELGAVISIALEYQDFATSFRPGRPRPHEVFIDRERIWSFSEQWPIVSILRSQIPSYPAPQLHEFDIAALKEYNAA
jgi:hypothetical protein